MEFQCGSCGAVMEAPDEIGGAMFECPNCGEDIVAPHAGDVDVEVELKDPGVVAGAPGQAQAPAQAGGASAPLTESAMYAEEAAMSLGKPQRHTQRVREKRKKRPEEKLGWAFWLLILLALATLALGGYYLYVNVPEVTETVDKWLGKEAGEDGRKKAVKAREPGQRRVLPAGYYLAKTIAGASVEGAAAGVSEWTAPGAEEGKRWLVVEMSVPSGEFLAPEDRYDDMKGEHVRRFGEDASAMFPPRDECRFFDPSLVFLVPTEGDEIEGSLIWVEFDGQDGFYQGFGINPSPGSRGGREEWMDPEAQIRIGVGFAVDGEGFNPAGLKVRLGELPEAKVPATLLRKEVDEAGAEKKPEDDGEKKEFEGKEEAEEKKGVEEQEEEEQEGAGEEKRAVEVDGAVAKMVRQAVEEAEREAEAEAEAEAGDREEGEEEMVEDEERAGDQAEDKDSGEEGEEVGEEEGSEEEGGTEAGE